MYAVVNIGIGSSGDRGKDSLSRKVSEATET